MCLSQWRSLVHWRVANRCVWAGWRARCDSGGTLSSRLLDLPPWRTAGEERERIALFSGTKEEEEVKWVFSVLFFFFFFTLLHLVLLPLMCAGAAVPAPLGVLPQLPPLT